MRFLPPDEDVVLYKTVFKENLLGRKKLSRALSDILERIEDPLVVALDGTWGTGKSYFLKRWVAAHTDQNEGTALTIYFDAFAHDYLSDPLISLVGALSARVPQKDKTKLTKIRKAASEFIKPATRIGLSLATFGASEALNDLGDAAAKAIEGETKNALEKFWKKEEGRQVAMAEFRDSIESLTKSKNGKDRKPLIIVVDELDRCRPDYALEILEVIKHFFAVPHVHFILGVNLVALENSVKARYGSGIDATAYLQKFLSFTTHLPEHIGDREQTPAILKYLDHLGSAMATPSHLLEEIKIQVNFLSNNNSISMRDIGKIMSTASLLSEEAKLKDLFRGYRSVMVFLLIVRIIKPKLLKKIVDASIDEKELLDFLGANDPYINEYLSDGTSNYQFNRYLSHHQSMWIWICRDGKVKKDDTFPAVERWFSDYRDVHNPKRFPKEIYEKYLATFEVSKDVDLN